MSDFRQPDGPSSPTMNHHGDVATGLRALLSGGRESRRTLRRLVHNGRDDHWHLLPAELPNSGPSQARERALLSDRGCCPARRFSRLQALSSGRVPRLARVERPWRSRRAGDAFDRGRRGDDVIERALTLRLPYRPPFDWPTLFAWLRARAIPGVAEARDGVYRRTLRLPRGAGIATLESVNAHIRCTLRLESMADLTS